MPKNKTYLVYGRVDVETCVEITAPSLQEAVQQAVTKLKWTDFVEIAGDFIDGDGLRLIGVSEVS